MILRATTKSSVLTMTTGTVKATLTNILTNSFQSLLTRGFSTRVKVQWSLTLPKNQTRRLCLLLSSRNLTIQAFTLLQTSQPSSRETETSLRRRSGTLLTSVRISTSHRYSAVQERQSLFLQTQNLNS